jgi:DNA-binding transcriptional regulator YiaG
MDQYQLRQRRERLGLTQTKLSRCFGVTLRTVQKWEAGENPIRPIVELALITLEHLKDEYDA